MFFLNKTFHVTSTIMYLYKCHINKLCFKNKLFYYKKIGSFMGLVSKPHFI